MHTFLHTCMHMYHLHCTNNAYTHTCRIWVWGSDKRQQQACAEYERARRVSRRRLDLALG